MNIVCWLLGSTIGWMSTGEGNFPGVAADWGYEKSGKLVALGRMPATNDNVRLGYYLPGAATVRMTNDWTSAFYQFNFRTPSAANGPLVFDGRGYGIYPPATPIDTYYVEAFHLLNSSDSHVFSVENWGVSGGAKREPSFTVDDPVVESWYTQGDATSHFRVGGNWNVYDPVGEPRSGRTWMIGSAQANVDIVFSNATLRIGGFNYNAVNETANRPLLRRFGFENATLETVVRPTFPYVVNYSKQLSASTNILSFVNSTWLQQQNYSLNLATTLSYLEYPVLVASNSTIATQGEINFGKNSRGIFHDSTFHAVNGSACYLRDDADVLFEGGCFTNALLQTADARAGSRFVFSGGRHYPAGLRIGYNTTGSGLLILTNGTEITALDNDVELGGNATGMVTIASSSRLTVPNGNLALGFYETGVGSVRVTGGSVVDNAYSSREVRIGHSGQGTLEIDGGTVYGCTAAIGYNANATAESSVVLRNGSFELSAGADAVLTMSRAAHTSSLTLGSNGVLRAAAVRGVTAGRASLAADGGTIISTGVNGSYPLLGGLATATLGAAGLTLDTAGFSPRVTQSLVNASGAEGTLVKTGQGTLTVASPTYEVAHTRIRQGTFCYANAAPTAFATSLDLQGGTFSTVGETTSLTIGDLVITNGTVSLDPGDVLTVTGSVSIRGLAIDYSSVPEGAVTAFVFTSPLPAEAAEAVGKAVTGATVPYGKHVQMTLTTSGETTTATAEIVDDEPLGADDTVAWRGTFDDWNEAANWQPVAVPAVGKRTLFDSASALKEITVPDGARATALAFAEAGYRLAGETLTLDGEDGTVRLETTAASAEIAAPIRTERVLTVDGSSGSELTLSGTLTGVGVRKAGLAHLTLSASNDCERAAMHRQGLLTVKNEKAISGLDWYGDTLETVSEDGSAFTFDEPLVLSPSNSTAAIVFKNENDVTVNDMTLTDGAFIKRGAGRLTMAVKDGMTFAYGEGNWVNTSPGVYSAPAKLVFKADGTSPSGSTEGGYAGLSVVEGEFYLKPAVAGTTPKLSAQHCFLLGARTVSGTCAPTVTVDHVIFDITKGSGVASWLGSQMTEGYSVKPFANTCTMNAINGATVLADTLMLGGYNVSAIVNATDSILRPSWTWELNATGTGVARIRGKNSTFNVTNGDGGSLLQINGNVDLDYDACCIRSTNENTSKPNNLPRFTANANAAGEIVFRNGTELRLWRLVLTAVAKPLTLAFDDARWSVDMGGTDQDFTFSNSWVNASAVKIEMRNRGLVLQPTSGKTYSVELPLTGTGGFVNAGAGTVKFLAGSYCFTGPLSAEAGDIDLSAAGTLTNATIAAGEGTIKGGVFRNATIALAALGGAVPTFENCTFTGITRVTFTGEPTTAKAITIANFSGALTGVDTFRLKGWKGYRGDFALEDGKVVADIASSGLTVIVR